ncbi:MAG: hypothetical protein HZB17_06700 [Chloroflexi bacterium]|nr:hypothetical protein [Chloroflexota bacterium]MBI5080978.1 hypothetical protein [Chloroflexota bacterium]
MTLQPGERTTVYMKFGMHGPSMAGKHNFRVHLITNDPAEKDRGVTLISNWVP